MKLIVGLGNPGKEYAHTKHNVGFDVLDIFAKKQKARILGRQCHSLVGSFENYGEQIVLAKPQTFMNNSGMAVGELVRKYHLEPSDVLVIFDDLDLPLGKIRIKPQGSAGGHKGMTSIIQHLHTNEFPRIRVGIGRKGEAVHHVLTRFNRNERKITDNALAEAADALDMMLKEGIEAAMNVYNRAGE